MKKLLLLGIVFIFCISTVQGVLILEKLTDLSDTGYLTTSTNTYQRQEFTSNGTYESIIGEIGLSSSTVGKSPIFKFCISNNTMDNCVSLNTTNLPAWSSYKEYNFTFTGVTLKPNTVYNLTGKRIGTYGYNTYWASRTPETYPLMFRAYGSTNTTWTLKNSTAHMRFWGTKPITTDSCTYSGTGNWIITNNCNITTTVNLLTGYAMLIGTGKTVKFQTGGLLT